VPGSPDAVLRYHDGTKHHFQRFARSLGYLDWASQPAPFRSFAGAPRFPLFPSPEAPSTDYRPRAVSFEDVFAAAASPPAMGTPAIGDLLRHALGLSAWKAIGLGSGRETRWSLRCNPSSGNLHPTEAYVVSGPLAGLSDSPGVYHYVPERHLLELRCALDARAWRERSGDRDDLLLVALTSIHWRESWKYGERAFRYCQHDLGHAIAALVASASAIGWRACLVPEWPQSSLAALTGIDRDEDFVDAEREEPSCLLAIGPADVAGAFAQSHDRLTAAARAGQWFGRASQLSENHVQWTFIDDVAAATRDAGRPSGAPAAMLTRKRVSAQRESISVSTRWGWGPSASGKKSADARAIFLQRRSAVAFDGVSSISRDAFLSMLGAVMPHDSAPWSAIWWTPRIHLALFVHRVDDVAPGVYLLPRDEDAIPSLRASMTRDFLWETEATGVPLLCLARGDARRMAARVSCDQDIAADGFFSLGMIAALDASLREYGASFYRHLFWEAGFVGQILYLEAEAAGVRATGIGCYYDDPVHDVLGLQGHAFQSLYHFTVGTPVEDTRLTTMPGYTWERP
jgi:SagB-type dehydrogenase family enzyme